MDVSSVAWPSFRFPASVVPTSKQHAPNVELKAGLVHADSCISYLGATDRDIADALEWSEEYTRKVLRECFEKYSRVLYTVAEKQARDEASNRYTRHEESHREAIEAIEACRPTKRQVMLRFSLFFPLCDNGKAFLVLFEYFPLIVHVHMRFQGVSETQYTPAHAMLECIEELAARCPAMRTDLVARGRCERMLSVFLTSAHELSRIRKILARTSRATRVARYVLDAARGQARGFHRWCEGRFWIEAAQAKAVVAMSMREELKYITGISPDPMEESTGISATPNNSSESKENRRRARLPSSVFEAVSEESMLDADKRLSSAVSYFRRSEVLDRAFSYLNKELVGEMAIMEHVRKATDPSYPHSPQATSPSRKDPGTSEREDEEEEEEEELDGVENDSTRHVYDAIERVGGVREKEDQAMEEEEEGDDDAASTVAVRDFGEAPTTMSQLLKRDDISSTTTTVIRDPGGRLQIQRRPITKEERERKYRQRKERLISVLQTSLGTDFETYRDLIRAASISVGSHIRNGTFTEVDSALLQASLFNHGAFASQPEKWFSKRQGNKLHSMMGAPAEGSASSPGSSSGSKASENGRKRTRTTSAAKQPPVKRRRKKTFPPGDTRKTLLRRYKLSYNRPSPQHESRDEDGFFEDEGTPAHLSEGSSKSESDEEENEGGRAMTRGDIRHACVGSHALGRTEAAKRAGEQEEEEETNADKVPSPGTHCQQNGLFEKGVSAEAQGDHHIHVSDRRRATMFGGIVRNMGSGGYEKECEDAMSLETCSLSSTKTVDSNLHLRVSRQEQKKYAASARPSHKAKSPVQVPCERKQIAAASRFRGYDPSPSKTMARISKQRDACKVYPVPQAQQQGFILGVDMTALRTYSRMHGPTTLDFRVFRHPKDASHRFVGFNTEQMAVMGMIEYRMITDVLNVMLPSIHKVVSYVVPEKGYERSPGRAVLEYVMPKVEPGPRSVDNSDAPHPRLVPIWLFPLFMTCVFECRSASDFCVVPQQIHTLLALSYEIRKGQAVIESGAPDVVRADYERYKRGIASLGMNSHTDELEFLERRVDEYEDLSTSYQYEVVKSSKDTASIGRHHLQHFEERIHTFTRSVMTMTQRTKIISGLNLLRLTTPHPSAVKFDRVRAQKELMNRIHSNSYQYTWYPITLSKGDDFGSIVTVRLPVTFYIPSSGEFAKWKNNSGTARKRRRNKPCTHTEDGSACDKCLNHIKRKHADDAERLKSVSPPVRLGTELSAFSDIIKTPRLRLHAILRRSPMFGGASGKKKLDELVCKGTSLEKIKGDQEEKRGCRSMSKFIPVEMMGVVMRSMSRCNISRYNSSAWHHVYNTKRCVRMGLRALASRPAHEMDIPATVEMAEPHVRNAHIRCKEYMETCAPQDPMYSSEKVLSYNTAAETFNEKDPERAAAWSNIETLEERLSGQEEIQRRTQILRDVALSDICERTLMVSENIRDGAQYYARKRSTDVDGGATNHHLEVKARDLAKKQPEFYATCEELPQILMQNRELAQTEHFDREDPVSLAKYQARVIHEGLRETESSAVLGKYKRKAPVPREVGVETIGFQ